MEAMVKIGDTISDIEEGLNAGMWTIGLTKSGNSLGLSLDETDRLDPEILKNRLSEIETRHAGSRRSLCCGWHLGMFAHYPAISITVCIAANSR